MRLSRHDRSQLLERTPCTIAPCVAAVLTGRHRRAPLLPRPWSTSMLRPLGLQVLSSLAGARVQPPFPLSHARRATLATTPYHICTRSLRKAAAGPPGGGCEVARSSGAPSLTRPDPTRSPLLPRPKHRCCAVIPFPFLSRCRNRCPLPPSPLRASCSSARRSGTSWRRAAGCGPARPSSAPARRPRGSASAGRRARPRRAPRP